MPKPDTLIVIHYHLLAGGVCSAIKNSLAALAKAGWLADRVLRVLTGRSDGVREFVDALKQWGIKVEVEVEPRLDYTDYIWPDRDRFLGEASVLADWFLGQARGATLFWAHNPTLGKNPLVTAGLMIAGQEETAEDSEHRFLYHIHDFAECGRLWNLENLLWCWRGGGMEDFYPASPNFGYGVLNKADAQRLVQAGIPKERIFLLPNTVTPVRAETSKKREAILPELQLYAEENGYRFEPERSWWILPIRLIRRKNVLEALLLAAIALEPPQLLVTLDANSDPERPYAEAVKDLFRREQYAAVVGFGHELVGRLFSFDDLLLAADAVVTTSLMEGFGFTFLEGANRGRPLVGRNLSEVTADFIEAGFPAASLYDRFLVPVDQKTRETMIVRGCRFAHEKGRSLGLDDSTVDRFSDAVEIIFSQDAVDFGFLNLNQQLGITRLLEGDDFVRDLKWLNPEAAEPIPFSADFTERVEEVFGLEQHASRLANAFESLFVQAPMETPTENVSRRLLDLFFHPKYHRPLIGDW
jgi:glycosyltransferase involved in cell wall biosynthesis